MADTEDDGYIVWCRKNTINYHIKKIFEDGESQEDAVIRKFRITDPDGKSYNTNHYSLEMIIAVRFKTNSECAVKFRKWVNQIAKNYTIKGWLINDEHLKCSVKEMLSHEKYIGIEVVNVDGEDGQIYKLNYYHQANISKETFDAMQEENLKHSNTVI